MSAGTIVYKLFFSPWAQIKKIVQTGPIKYFRQERWRKKMVRASNTLKEISYPGKETFEVYFLTGKKYWYQTAFCLYSLQKHAGVNIRGVFVDDGTFDEALEKQVILQFPSSRVVIEKIIRQHLDNILPSEQYAALRERRKNYPHIRKLTDIHTLDNHDPKLVLDSDMLFFHKPTELLQWLRNPEQCLFMKDCEKSYGYSDQLMKEVAQSENLPDKLNVGVAGMKSEMINWKELNDWVKILQQKEGTSYLQEQGITAMMASRSPYILLDEVKYKVKPSVNGAPVKEVLHHYVAEAKYDYFVKAWPKVLTENESF